MPLFLGLGRGGRTSWLALGDWACWRRALGLVCAVFILVCCDRQGGEFREWPPSSPDHHESRLTDEEASYVSHRFRGVIPEPVGAIRNRDSLLARVEERFGTAASVVGWGPGDESELLIMVYDRADSAGYYCVVELVGERWSLCRVYASWLE